HPGHPSKDPGALGRARDRRPPARDHLRDRHRRAAARAPGRQELRQPVLRSDRPARGQRRQPVSPAAGRVRQADADRGPPVHLRLPDQVTMVRSLSIVLVVLLVAVVLTPWRATPPSHGQGVDVYINITDGGTRKLNIAIPDFTVIAGTDT